MADSPNIPREIWTLVIMARLAFLTDVGYRGLMKGAICTSLEKKGDKIQQLE